LIFSTTTNKNNMKHPLNARDLEMMTARELEIAQLELAIERMRIKQAELHELMRKGLHKLAAQEAEMRFQKMLARVDRQNAAKMRA
jgi:hypothetical protein